MKTAKFIIRQIVIDPDTQARTDISVFQHENGHLLALDLQYLQQHAGYPDRIIVADPFSDISDQLLLIP